MTVEERKEGGVISSVVIPLIGLEGLDDVSDDCRRIEKFIRDGYFIPLI